MNAKQGVPVFELTSTLHFPPDFGIWNFRLGFWVLKFVWTYPQIHEIEPCKSWLHFSTWHLSAFYCICLGPTNLPRKEKYSYIAYSRLILLLLLGRGGKSNETRKGRLARARFTFWVGFWSLDFGFWNLEFVFLMWDFGPNLVFGSGFYYPPKALCNSCVVAVALGAKVKNAISIQKVFRTIATCVICATHGWLFTLKSLLMVLLHCV